MRSRRQCEPLFAFPGIWRQYRGPVKKERPNADIETYSFLTTTPSSLVSTINHERMPVLLTREDEFEVWLRGSADEAFALARDYPPQDMRIVQECFLPATKAALTITGSHPISNASTRFADALAKTTASGLTAARED